MGFSLGSCTEWRLYEIVKYLIYLDCVAIAANSFLMYAEDNMVYKQAPEASNLWLYNYLCLGFNLGGPVAIYFYTYDGYLYKVGLFLVFVVVAMVIRICKMTKFYAVNNISNFIGVALGLYLIYIIWNGKSEQTYRVPVNQFMATKVSKQGSVVGGGRSRTSSMAPSPSPDGPVRRGSKSSLSSASGSGSATTSKFGFVKNWFGSKKGKEEKEEAGTPKSNSPPLTPDTPPPPNRTRSKKEKSKSIRANNSSSKPKSRSNKSRQSTNSHRSQRSKGSQMSQRSKRSQRSHRSSGSHHRSGSERSKSTSRRKRAHIRPSSSH